MLRLGVRVGVTVRVRVRLIETPCTKRLGYELSLEQHGIQERTERGQSVSVMEITLLI